MNIREIVYEQVKSDLPIEYRIIEIEKLNECYYKETGKFIPSTLLSVLGDWLLDSILKNRAGNKSNNEEYPILSKYQIQRRDRRVLLVEKEEVLDYIKHIRDNNLSRNSDSQSERLE